MWKHSTRFFITFELCECSCACVRLGRLGNRRHHQRKPKWTSQSCNSHLLVFNFINAAPLRRRAVLSRFRWCILDSIHVERRLSTCSTSWLTTIGPFVNGQFMHESHHCSSIECSLLPFYDASVRPNRL